MKGLYQYLVIILVLGLSEGCESQKAKVVTEKDIRDSRDLVGLSEKVNQGSNEWFKILDSAININPNNGEAYREKSVWATKTGDYVTAYKLLEIAVEKDPLNSLGYRGWLKLYKLHDFQGAITDLEKLDTLTPNFFMDSPWGENLYFLTGLSKMQLGQFDKALTDFNKYINNVSKTSGESWVDLYTFIDKASCLRKMSKIDSALVTIDKAIKYYRECPEAHFEKAFILKAAGQLQKSCEEFALAKKYVLEGRTRIDPYKDFFNQLYLEDVEENLLSCKN